MKAKIAILTAAVGLSLVLSSCANAGTAPDTNAAAPSNCVPKHDVTTVEAGYLTVAAYEYPPFAYPEGDGVGGAEGAILTQIAAMECLTTKALPGAGASMIPSITSGRADTTAGSWYRTAERAKVVLLSAPVLADRLIIVSKKGVGTVPDLKGHKVGSILGFLWNDDLQKYLGDSVKLFETAQAMYADLAAGRIDVVIDTYPSAQATLKKTPIDGLKFEVPPADPAILSTVKPGQINFPVNLDNPDLIAAFNEDIAELRKSGELEKILVSFGFQPEAADPGEPNLL
ncbi:ABC transporter substrate-binding protein [Cryobacterium sp. PH31-O1]|uniref:substrate-binding periplasmic protein n=1 Tax=Cryobacterium sp. PH31-O1 TaxID=3046306 RepID=UPI0024BAD2BC|nr:ABC transporter substrate-binding protein [Cryobacterium sp. PH31-O1]MDJ0336697.1 ABC transporter substrate-binding protein [Cryobacterium sp. PH31-O1]